MTFILLKRESKYSESKREMKTNKYRTLKRIYQRLKNTESPLIQNESRGFLKTAATYSPTVTQYHRRDEA